MSQKTILVVDDEKSFTDLTAETLERSGYRVERAYSGMEALQMVHLHQIDLVLLDMIMPVMHGLDTLKKIKEINNSIPVIVLTADSDVNTAVEGMKHGAYDYLTKPVDWNRLKIVIRNALLTGSLKAEVNRLRAEIEEKLGFDNVIGISPQMQEVFKSVHRILESDVTVSLLGESGTGKELLARAIHFNGPRRDKPFVAINCAAIPESLLESELFGHERGAFTGAVSTRIGKFEQANGGTIFLDEIGEMSPSTQVKLLRVLQERCIERVGGSRSIEVDVRIISATNKNLEDEMKKGNFRKDLFYRINVYPIVLPPLRERKEDIPVLASFFIQKFKENGYQHAVTGISSKAMEYLLNYHWPGNIRELENVIKRAILNARSGMIMPEHLPITLTSGRPFLARGNSLIDLRTALTLTQKIIPLEEIEKEVLHHALKLTNYNMSSTAQALGIGRTTLYRKIHKYGIPVPRFAVSNMAN